MTDTITTRMRDDDEKETRRNGKTTGTRRENETKNETSKQGDR